MILYYSDNDIYADVFVQILSLFISEPVTVFSFDNPHIDTVRLVIIDGEAMHPQKLRKILRHCPKSCSIILMSDGQYNEPQVTTQVEAALPIHVVAKLCDCLLSIKKEKSDSVFFSQKEERLLPDLQKGLSNKEMARTQGLPLSSVKYHLQNIYAKLGVNNRTQAALKLGQTSL